MPLNPFFSVIIPTYNRAELLRQALASVFYQEFRDFEVIVVDDGSTEDQSSVEEEWRGRVTFIRQANGGPGAARNLGTQAAHGAYLAFLDSDDQWFPWTLATFANLIKSHDFPAILSARLVEFGDQLELANVRVQPVKVQSFDDYFASSSQPFFVGAGMSILRRDHFLDVNGFRPGQVNAEDHDLILRMGVSSGFVQVLEPATLAWRRHPGTATTDFGRTWEGVRYLVNQERHGAYPGGMARARERREIICRHVRPVILERCASGFRRHAWQLYRSTLGWHLAQLRLRFVVGFPLSTLLRRQ